MGGSPSGAQSNTAAYRATSQQVGHYIFPGLWKWNLEQGVRLAMPCVLISSLTGPICPRLPHLVFAQALAFFPLLTWK